MKKNIVLLLLLAMCTQNAIAAHRTQQEGPDSGDKIAQTTEPSAKKEEKKEPKGKFIIQVFSNLHTGFGKQNDDRGFELERSYLGYEHNLGKGLTVKGVMDIGKSSSVDDYHRIVYIKNALISWKKDRLTLNAGLISTTQFNFQEKFWGYRYVMKSFQDQYKFGNSADLGISAAYKFNDWISADAIIVNGEGYKKVQFKDGFNYGLGTTITPLKGLSIRLYGGLNECAQDGKDDTWNMATFVGYKTHTFAIGAEYNHMWNAAFNHDADLYGYSLHASAKVTKWADLIARFDDVYSTDNWNVEKDERSLLLGAQFKIWKYIKLAPNFRMAMPKTQDAKNEYSAYLNCYFGI